MKDFWNVVQLAFAAIGGWLGWFMGGCDGLLFALIAFVAADYITGVMCAIIDKKLSSEVGFKGIFKKVLIFILVGVANILDVQVIGSGCVLRTAVIFFYISNEGVSLLENAGHLGLPRQGLLECHTDGNRPPSGVHGTAWPADNGTLHRLAALFQSGVLRGVRERVLAENAGTVERQHQGLDVWQAVSAERREGLQQRKPQGS